MGGIISLFYTESYDWAAINQQTRMWNGGYVAQFMVCPSSCLKGLRKTTNIFKFVCFPVTIRIINRTSTRRKLYRSLNCVHHFLCGPEFVSSSVCSWHVITESYDWAAINQQTRMWNGGYVAQFMVCPSSCLKGLRKTTNIFKFVCFPVTIRIINRTSTRRKLYRSLNCVHHFLCGPEFVSSSVYSWHVMHYKYQLTVQIFTYNYLSFLNISPTWFTALQAGRSRVRFSMVSLDFFHWHNPSGHTMAVGLTQPLTEMSTGNISWG